ncbi:MAG: Gfo/Idh/MocA family oxidoreductase [Treponema sp.]|nr:Gfo/Idh/MocA family oxidoreductase [Treponema sp.]MCL2272903.1 Gfo/Idh/MocA family oxidoreductase [Treponema sp.]
MISAAIVGTGNISPQHFKGYLAFPDRCKITHLVDIFPEKAEKKNDEYKTGAKVSASHKDILNAQDIDLVSVCTPPFCHAQIAVDFLNAGKNVLVEKPMAASLEECDAMLEAAKKNGKILSVIAQNRFRDPVYGLKKVLDTQLMGKIVHAQVESCWWRGHSYYDLWWRGTWEKEGGGCTLNHAVHHIDMLCWMLGLPEKVSAVLSNASHDNAEVEDISVAVLQYAGGLCAKGALAQVTSSVIHHGEEQQLIFQGEKARVSWPWKVTANTAQPNGFPEAEQNTALIKQLDDYYNSLPKLVHSLHEGQIDDVLSAIEKGTSPLIGGEDGKRTIELITGIYKAGAEQRTVDLPVKKDDPFYTVNGMKEKVPHFYQKSKSINTLDGNITYGRHDK